MAKQTSRELVLERRKALSQGGKNASINRSTPNRVRSSMDARSTRTDQSFVKTKVDAELDWNYNPENNLVNTNLDGNQISYIPVSGIYNLDADITDADIKDGGSGAFYIYMKKSKE